jgi:hypothetical protein
MSDLEVISISSGDTSPSPGDTPVVVLSSLLDASFDPHRWSTCGCSYKITLIHEEDNKILFKETLLPPSHDESVGLKRSASICITNEVHQRIDYLAKHHLFDPNYGAKKVCDMCV